LQIDSANSAITEFYQLCNSTMARAEHEPNIINRVI